MTDAAQVNTERIFERLDSISSAPWMDAATLVAKLRTFGWGDRFLEDAVRQWMAKKSKRLVKP